MSLYKRSDSSFLWYRFEIDGNLYRGPTKTTDRKLASMIETKARHDVLTGQIKKTPSTMTVAELFRWAEKTYWSQTPTYKRYADEFYLRFVPMVRAFGKIPAYKIMAQQLTKYRGARIAGGILHSSANREIGYLRAAINLAIDAGLLFENPCEGVPFTKEDDRIRTRILSPHERERLLTLGANIKLSEADKAEIQAVASPLLMDLIVLALKTGMRQGEILDLKWKNINFEVGHVRVISYKGGQPIMRLVPLHPQVLEIIRRQPVRGEHVFSYVHGERLSANGVVHSSYMKLLQRLQIYEFTFHDLRHTFGTDHYRQYRDLKRLALILGHASTKTTERYANLVESEIHASVFGMPFDVMPSTDTKSYTVPLAVTANSTKTSDNQLSGV